MGLVGLDSLEPAVRAAFAEELIDPELALIQDWEVAREVTQGAPDDVSRFHDQRVGYLEDLCEELAWVTRIAVDDWPDDEPQADTEPPYDSPAPMIHKLRDVGRNDPCPCGSGRKYKKCCLNA